MHFAIHPVKQRFIEFLANESEVEKRFLDRDIVHHVLKDIFAYIGERFALARHQAFNPASVEVLDVFNVPVQAFLLEGKIHYIEGFEDHAEEFVGMPKEFSVFSHREKLERSLNESDEGLKYRAFDGKISLSDIPDSRALLDLSKDG